MKKTSFIVALAFIVGLTIGSSNQENLKEWEEDSYNYQLLTVEQCKNSSIHELYCQTHDLDIKVNSNDLIPIAIEVLHRQPTILRSGYVCTGVNFHISCDTNFFGVDKISKWKTSSDITDAECEKEVNTYLSGTQVDLSYPLKECSWMAYKEMTKKVITVTPHEFHFNIKSEKIDDPLISGHCAKESICMTTRSYQKVRFSGKLDYEPEKYVVYDIGFFNPEESRLYSTLIGSIETKTLTTFKLMGKTWYQGQNSLGFSTDFDFGIKKKAPETDVPEDHNRLFRQDLTRLLDKKSRQYVESQFCTQVLPIIKRQELISAHQLEILKPHFPGSVTVFVMNNTGNLYSCKGTYAPPIDDRPKQAVTEGVSRRLIERFGSEMYTNLGYYSKGLWRPYSQTLGALEDKIVSSDVLHHWKETPLNYHYQELGLNSSTKIESSPENSYEKDRFNLDWIPSFATFSSPIFVVLLQVLLLISLLYLIKYLCTPKTATRQMSI
ncbi:G protein [Sclerotinia sclerotiorum rhabdovirus 1]|nr:G protein [Sclerotinia sclerotiorum rhabdovirus 1]